MTVKEFIDNNSDILVSRITPRDFKDLTDGCVVFCVTAASGKKPILERAVKSAGYQLVVSTSHRPGATIHEIITLALTQRGYAKIDYIDVDFIGDDGHKMLFLCKPLPQHDPRRDNCWMI
jgi:hypothetical protein